MASASNDATVAEDIVHYTLNTIIGSRAALRVLARMRREEPHLAKVLARHIRLVVKTLAASGAPSCIVQQVEDALDILLARLYVGITSGRDRMWCHPRGPSS